MSRKRIKQYLTLLLAIGVIAIVASGSGTFASFQAETTNDNNTFATGTLFLHNKVGTGTTCTSESASGNFNASGCDVLFSITNLGPSDTHSVNLTLTNAGSVDSSLIQFKAVTQTGSAPCLNSAASIGSLASSATDSATTLVINNLSQTVTPDTLLQLQDNTNTAIYKVTTLTTPATAAGSGIPVALVSNSPSGPHTFNTGSTTVTFKLGFVTSPALCSRLQMYIDSMDSTFTTSSGCVYGTATGGPGTPCSTTGGTALSSLPLTLTAFPTSVIASPQLAAGASQYLRITVVAPGNALSNTDMTTQAKFGLTWHIEH